MPRLPAARLFCILGLAALAALTVSLPFADLQPSFTAHVVSYALALVPVAALIYGFPDLVRDLATPRLLTLGAVSATLGFLAALACRPDAFDAGPRLLPLALLYLANVLRLCAAASLGLALARYVISPGVALLIAVLAAVSDLFSVLAGPTKVLLSKGSPALDFLILVFPSFGAPLGFGFGLSDFVFLALFAYISLLLGLRYQTTLLFCSAAAMLAAVTALSLEQPLPALPFICLGFVLANIWQILARMRK
ncbi:MAG TPA: hypothetical protein VFJ72_10740 [Rubrobacteraceae bacterium]|nr:hypothetical protein [Rubrobacteraceae bacterium]